MLKSSWVDKEGRKASLRSDGLAVYDQDTSGAGGRSPIDDFVLLQIKAQFIRGSHQEQGTGDLGSTHA